MTDVNAITGAHDANLWQTIGWTDAGRLLVATDSAVVTVDRRGQPVSSEPWDRDVVDTGTFLVWPDGRFSTGPSPGTVGDTVVAVDPRNRRVAATRSTEAGTELLMLDADSLRPTSTSWQVDGEVTMARFSPDGRHLLLGAGERVQLA